MNNVIIKGNECFISSEALSVMSDNEHRAVRQLIRSHKTALESFGVLTFEMSKPTSPNGGRPTHNYYLNEQQATLLTTFMSNSHKVVEFKKKLVKSFFEMREYILNQEKERAIGKEIRKTLTDVVKESGEVERMHGHAYSTYTRLAYSLVGIYPEYQEFKKNAGKDDTAKFRDTLSGHVLERLKTAEIMIRSLLSLDKEYAEIKNSLKPFFDVKEIN